MDKCCLGNIWYVMSCDYFSQIFTVLRFAVADCTDRCCCCIRIQRCCRRTLDTCFWPLFECYDGEKWVVNYIPKEKLPIEDFLRSQGRFAHLFKPENEHLIEDIQREIDRRWENLLTRANA